jgi:hypothetical protein
MSTVKKLTIRLKPNILEILEIWSEKHLNFKCD